MKYLISRISGILLLMLAGKGLLMAQTGSTAAPSSSGGITAFEPGAVWLDTDGKPINAHGGGLLFYKGTYYWYGEYKKGRTELVPHSNWENYRVLAGGVSCYSSKDLLHWKFEGLALASEQKDSTSDLYAGKVIERPKVVFNPRTKKFVLWMHIDSKDYSAAKSGVAVSDKPTGPFRYLGSERPNGNMARDMTIFQDEDGRAYHVYTSEDNQTLHVCQLSDDYLSHTRNDKRLLVGLAREGAAVFKFNKHYYLISSACTGWDPNAAAYAVADSMMGEWKQRGNPCKGPGADKTYGGQSAFVLPVNAAKGQFIFIGDLWNKKNLEDSRYLWLPLRMNGAEPEIYWQDKWTVEKYWGLDQQAYKLVWSDEFNTDGKPDPKNWSYEEGFVRNNEAQWYQSDNAYCKSGYLVIEAKREQKKNPNYVKDSQNWKKSRPSADYTSACMITKDKQQWLYGRWEMRGRIDINPGCWPAWWALGLDKSWPENGEIDMMEYYRDSLLANIAIGSAKPYRAYWYSKKTPVDQAWASKFHVWRMDWDSSGIALYVDDRLLNQVPMEELVNKDGSGYSPFQHPQYMLLNLAIGGDNGGDPAATAFPKRFEVDYVRVYQKK